MINSSIRNGTGLIILYDDNSTKAYNYIENCFNFFDREGNPLSPLVPIVYEEDLNMCLYYVDKIVKYKLIKEY